MISILLSDVLLIGIKILSNPIAIPAEMWYNIHMETEERIDYRKANNETLYAMRQMVDSNLHRERLLPSEKAFAYKMKLDAIKHRGKSLSQVATKSDSAAEVGAAMGESRDMVFRYIRLTNLVPPLLDMVDEGKIALMPAERLSYLTGEEQLALVDIMEDLEVTPSLSQAVKLKDLSASHRLDPDTMYEVMEKPKANQRETVKLDADTLRRFFPDYTPKQMETAILRMLEEAERERQRQKILRRSRDDAR